MSEVVLITGGLGYIGGRLTHHLSMQADRRVRIGTRNPDQTLPTLIGRNRSQSTPDDLTRYEYCSLDLESPVSLDAACKDVRCVIHLAALNEIDSAANPRRALEVNTIGTLELVQSAVRAGVQRLIYFSTAHIYGAPLLGEINESLPCRPVHPYAYTHKAAEDIVLAAAAEKKLSAVVFRLANGFGRPMHATVNRWTLLVNDLCRQAVMQRKLVLKTPGLQPRNFITLADVAEATAHFLGLESSALGDGVFNIGGGRSLTILEMTELIAARCEKVLGFRPPIERPAAAAQSERQFLNFSITKAKAAGFTPKDAYEAEVDGTLEFCAKAFQRE